MISAIQDPQDQQVPKFGLSFPIRVAYDEVLQYFEDEEPFYPRSEFPVLVFDLRRPLNSQMVIAKAELQKIQKSETLIKPKNISQKKWTTYLRLIDGEATGAMPKEIRKFIEAYHPKSNDPEDLKKATDAFSDHRKQAHALRDNPLAILPIDSPKFLGMKTGEDSQ
jgi:hypothetical protein